MYDPDPNSGSPAHEVPAQANSHRLSPSEYRAALDDARREHFQGKHPSSHPVAIIVAGQPGAGKIFLTLAAKSELAPSGGAIAIDVDELLGYHPRFPALAEDDLETSATRMQPDALQMSKDLCAEARAKRYNLIIDDTLHDPNEAEKMVRDLRSDGYKIEFRALAVPMELSRLSVVLRLENAFADPNGGAIPHIVEPRIHDEAYYGLPKVLERLEQAGIADRITVFERMKTSHLYDSFAGTIPGPDRTSSFVPPANLYDGIFGVDPEDVAVARQDRERGFLARLRAGRHDARENGDTAKEQELAHMLVTACEYFEKRAILGGHPDRHQL